MSRGIPRTLAILCLVAILGSLVLQLVAGTACLRARSASNCQRCCQSDTASESQSQAAPCSLFCCTGLPGVLRVCIPPALSLAFALPGIHDLSAPRTAGRTKDGDSAEIRSIPQARPELDQHS